MSEMVERVALAIKRHQIRPNANLSPDGPWREFELDAARAAIEAMREPTEAMMLAGWAAQYRGVGSTEGEALTLAAEKARSSFDVAFLKAGWAAAIDAARKPTGEQG